MTTPLKGSYFLASGEEGEHINAMIFDGKRFVGIGQGATYFSLDGRAWERVPNRNVRPAHGSSQRSL